MDAIKIYKLLSPHLNHLDPSELKKLSQLITNPPKDRTLKTYRRNLSPEKAKEALKEFRLLAIAKERKANQA